MPGNQEGNRFRNAISNCNPFRQRRERRNRRALRDMVDYVGTSCPTNNGASNNGASNEGEENRDSIRRENDSNNDDRSLLQVPPGPTLVRFYRRTQTTAFDYTMMDSSALNHGSTNSLHRNLSVPRLSSSFESPYRVGTPAARSSPALGTSCSSYDDLPGFRQQVSQFESPNISQTFGSSSPDFYLEGPHSPFEETEVRSPLHNNDSQDRSSPVESPSYVEHFHQHLDSPFDITGPSANVRIDEGSLSSESIASEPDDFVEICHSTRVPLLRPTNKPIEVPGRRSPEKDDE